MNNAELLVELRKITQNSDEYDELLAQKGNIEKQIEELKIKLSDEDNYKVSSFDRDALEKTINGLNLELERNQISISANTNKVNDIENAIASYNELISEDEKQLEEITDEETIERIKRNKKYLETDLAMLMTSKESLNAVIENSNERNKDITLLIERYKQIKEEGNEVEIAYSDERIEDENKLSELENNLEQIVTAISYFDDDVKKDIKTLIASIEGGVIDSVDIFKQLLEIKIELQGKEEFEKLEEVKLEQENLEKQIDELESKLSNSVNYTPSVVDVAEINKDIESSESNISEYEQVVKESEYDIHKRESYIDKLNASIDGRKEKVYNLNLENNELRFERAMNPSDSKSFDKQIDLNKRKIKRIEEGIERCEKIVIGLEQEISLIKKNKKNYENLKNRDIKDLNTRKSDLEDKKTVNALEMSKDKKQLSSLIGQLAALKAIESLTNAEINEAIDNLITNYYVTAQQSVLEANTLAGEEVQDIEPDMNEFVSETVVTPVDDYNVVESTAEFVDSSMFAPIDFGSQEEYVAPEGNVEFEPLPTENVENKNEEPIENVDSEVEYEDLMSVEPVSETVVEQEVTAPQVVVEEVKVLPIQIVTIKDAPLALIEKTKNSRTTKDLKERLVTCGLVLGLVAGAKQTAYAEALPTVEIDKLNDSIIESEYNYDELENADNQVESSYEMPETTYETVESSYEMPETTYETVESSYEAPETTYETVESSYEAPETTYEAVESSYEAPETTYETVDADYEMPETTYETVESSYEAPETTFETVESSYEMPETTYETVDAGYETPVTQVDDFYDAIEKLENGESTTNYNESDSNYDKMDTETQISDTTPEFEYQPISDNGYEVPEEFVIGGDAVSNEEINNTSSALTKEEEEFLAALMQQQKENEVSKSL